MSRSHRQLVIAEQAESAALARMFRVWNSAGVKKDGTDIVLEAFDAADFRKRIAGLLHESFKQDGEVDEAAIGKIVTERLIEYAKSCPVFEDYLTEAEVDLTFNGAEDEEREYAMETRNER